MGVHMIQNILQNEFPLSVETLIPEKHLSYFLSDHLSLFMECLNTFIPVSLLLSCIGETISINILK